MRLFNYANNVHSLSLVHSYCASCISFLSNVSICINLCQSDLLSRQNWFENLLNERINLDRGTDLTTSGAKYTYCSSTINVVNQQQQQQQQYRQVTPIHHQYQPIPYKSSSNYSSSLCQSISSQGGNDLTTNNKQQYNTIKHNNNNSNTNTAIAVGHKTHR